MKLWFQVTAAVSIVALIVFNGCAEPTPVAKSPPASGSATESVEPDPAVARVNDLGGSGDLETAPESGNLEAVPSVPSEPIKREPPVDGGNPADAEPSKPVIADKEEKKPRKEFRLEFVAATGEEGLTPGDTIPNIKGKDVDGIRFELSDYAGKVVMLDFWGDW